MKTRYVVLCAFLCHALFAQDQPQNLPPGYRVETIATPPGVEMEVGAIGFEPGGSILVTTRYGQVWRLKDGQWSLFAEGLHEPLGIWIDPGNGDAYIAQRPELTRLVDTNKDGKADVFQTLAAGWGFSGNYHEYAFGPIRDSKGNFYVTLNLSHSEIGRVRESVMGKAAAWRGWAMQVTPDGAMVPFANGMRSPAGLGISKDDEIFYADNQGDFNATSGLYHIKQGRFFGHPNSLAEHPDYKGKDLNTVPLEELNKLRTLPAIWIPHGELANSPGDPVFDYTQGKFGPFAGQIFIGDQTKCNVMRIALEKVGGEYQGAIFNFIGPLHSGVVRNTFAPDGSLYVGMTARGWGAIGPKPFALQRIVYDGKTIPFETHAISITQTGFDITFTQPLDPTEARKPDNYGLRHWGYLYRPDYGSPKVDETTLKPTSVTLSDDHKTVHLSLPLLTQRVYMFHLQAIAAKDGAKLTNPIGYYTLNRLHP